LFFSVVTTSTIDFCPKLLIFSRSFNEYFIRSSSEFILALFKQLYARADKFNSSIKILVLLFNCEFSFNLIGTEINIENKLIKISDAFFIAHSGVILPFVQISKIKFSLSKRGFV
jgi:hypothetical protein